MAAPAACSGTPLWRKPGIRPGTVVLTVTAPAGHRNLLIGLPDGVAFVAEVEPPLAFVHLFVTSTTDLAFPVPALAPAPAPDGAVWVSWPKQGSGVKAASRETASGPRRCRWG
jgi:hypothetical protein